MEHHEPNRTERSEQRNRTPPSQQPFGELAKKSILISEKPRERLAQYGPDKLSAIELVSLILGSGIAGKPVAQIAAELIAVNGGVVALGQARLGELQTRSGMGLARAARLVAAFELGRRALLPPRTHRVAKADDVYQLYRARLTGLSQEIGLVLALNAKNHVIAEVEIARGQVDSIPVHPREVFRPLIRHSAVSGIFIHNHPSGDPTPSEPDISLTRRLVEVAHVIGIPILDHVVIGHQGYASVMELL